MKVKPTIKQRIVISSIVFSSFVAALYFGSLAWLDLSYTKSGYLDFALHKKQYEQMVAEAKQRGVPPAGSNTLAPPRRASNATTNLDDHSGYVTTTRDPSGYYTISIVTKDMRHAGIYGYVYSDLPAKIDNANGSNDGAVSPFRSLDRQINQHWWAVSDNTF